MKTCNSTPTTVARVRSLVAVLGVATVFTAAQNLRGQTTRPAPVINSLTVPADVGIPNGFPGNPIAFFDDYSWRTFVALVWPALQGQRGKPDPNHTVGEPGPRVFETYKALWEVFHNDGSAPSNWNDFDDAKYNPCGVNTAWGDLSLGSFSKFSDLGQAGFGNLVGPLVAQTAQDPSYVRFFTAYNQTSFEQIVKSKWYLRSSLPQPPQSITFGNGAVTVKASWMDMTHAAHPERYYTRKAWVLDPVTGASSQKTVGLVGIHLVQKTPTRPQWIWSTFEHVDNVPPAEPGAPGTFAFNDGSGAPMPATNPYSLQRVLQPPTALPFNVTRVKPVDPSTQETNRLYRAALKGTVWEFYGLVMTQWPTTPSSPTTPGDPAHTFPGAPPADKTAFANTTMETFDQRSVFTSCMACHNATMAPTDFVWSINDHAFPASSATPNLLMKNPAFRSLRTMLENAPPPPPPGAAEPKRR